jgi:hypothetical protein
MRGNNDAPRSRVAREHLAAAIIGFDRRLEVDCLNIQNLAGRCHASYIIIADTGVTFNLVDNRRKRCKPPCKKWTLLGWEVAAQCINISLNALPQ